MPGRLLLQILVVEKIIRLALVLNLHTFDRIRVADHKGYSNALNTLARQVDLFLNDLRNLILVALVGVKVS